MNKIKIYPAINLAGFFIKNVTFKDIIISITKKYFEKGL
ncbi:hypothetical protein SAMN04488588_0862 [Geotoga petraea]|jgi:hypothetical protein|uniref:Uncharacterized protein n=1 Tax=Geotoga petraea TaxID=28234 RepID=A0A1G6KSK2_9BACT|nr:hypothetical protein SAMN04488588_0862 [Geotoga petraea]